MEDELKPTALIPFAKPHENEGPSGRSILPHFIRTDDQVLTVAEVAQDLRCSKAHIYNAINGSVPGVSPLPAISMGRRRLVRRSTLEQWKTANERAPSDAMLIASLKNHAADA